MADRLAPTRDPATRAWTCASCGAPLPPGTSVQCPYCTAPLPAGHVVELPSPGLQQSLLMPPAMLAATDIAARPPYQPVFSRTVGPIVVMRRTYPPDLRPEYRAYFYETHVTIPDAVGAELVGLQLPLTVADYQPELGLLYEVRDAYGGLVWRLHEFADALGQPDTPAPAIAEAQRAELAGSSLDFPAPAGAKVIVGWRGWTKGDPVWGPMSGTIRRVRGSVRMWVSTASNQSVHEGVDLNPEAAPTPQIDCPGPVYADPSLLGPTVHAHFRDIRLDYATVDIHLETERICRVTDILGRVQCSACWYPGQ